LAGASKSSKLGQFEAYRKAVLQSTWLRALDPAESLSYLQGLSDARYASVRYRQERAHPLIQPRGGVPTFERQRELTLALAEAGADFIPLTIDSLTRHNDYERAAALAELAEKEDKPLLNGYPLVCHGSKLTRLLYEGVERPISLRHGTPDARVLVEVALASGITEIEGGGLCYSLPYSREYPIDRALLNWQYVDRMCAECSTPERPIHRESFGPMTATMIPPAMVVVVQVLELLMAAEQGVRSFAVSFGQTGCTEQDIGTARALRSVASSMLGRFGFDELELRLVYHQWMGAFPRDRVQADALIAGSAFVAALAQADKIVTKTYQEALGVPTIEANCAGVRLVRYVFERFGALPGFDSQRCAQEQELIVSQATFVLERVFDLPASSLWESVVHAVSRGMIDIPFAPHAQNHNRLIGLRDERQAIRILNAGNMPMKPEDLRAEQQLLRQVSNNTLALHERLLRDINLMV
jgi:methylaspartate mutase epsilon subunit